MTIIEIYEGGERYINQLLAKESFDQGHTLSGAMEESFTAVVKKRANVDMMEGFAVFYTEFVNNGVPASSVSFAQFPFLVEFFKQRGIRGENDRDAKAAAAATIHTWMKQGMPTQASKRFSKTGSRVEMIESAFVGNENKIDDYFSAAFDFSVEETFQKTKSETI